MPAATPEEDAKLFYFILKYTEKSTPPWNTIATAMGLTSGAVQKRYERAMKRLGGEFEVSGAQGGSETTKATKTTKSKAGGKNGKRNADTKTDDEGPTPKKVETETVEEDGVNAKEPEFKDDDDLDNNGEVDAERADLEA